MQSSKVTEHFARVSNRWVVSSEEERASSRFLQDIAGEFLLIIKEAGGVYPEAYGRLSEVFMSLGDKKKSQQAAQTALQQNPYEATAWRTRLAIALEPFAEHTEFRRNAGSAGGILGWVGRDIVNREMETKAQKEVHSLVAAYHQLVNRGTDTESWLSMSFMMLEMADILHEFQLMRLRGWPNLYAEVANAPWHKIENSGHEEEIAELRQTAEGRMLLYP